MIHRVSPFLLCYILRIYAPEFVNLTAVKYHGGRNYTKRVNKHTPNRRKHHPIDPPTPTQKPSLSLPRRSLATHASSGFAYRGAPCPLAATCAAALSCHTSAAASRRDARARVMAIRSIAPHLTRGKPASLGCPGFGQTAGLAGSQPAGGIHGSRVLAHPRVDILSPRQNMPRSIVKKHVSVESPVRLQHS